MNNLLYKRRVRQMQKEKEQEEKRTKNIKKTKVAVGALTAVGVGYAGYKYREEIANTAGVATAKVAEQVAKVTGNKNFQTRVQEQKNVMSAIAQTYEQEQGGAYNTFSSLLKNQDPKKRSEEVKKRISILNETTQEIARRTNIPQDIRNVTEEMSAESYRVYQETDLRNLGKILKSDKFEDTIGENAEKLLDIARDSTKKSEDNLFAYTRPEKVKTGEVNNRLMDSILKFTNNKDVNIDLGLNTKEEVMETAVNFQNAIHMAQEETREQQSLYRKAVEGIASEVDINKLKGNIFAEESLFNESVRYKAFTERANESSGRIRESLLKEGWDSLTIGDAKSTVVEKNGKYFIDNQQDKGQTIDELFSPSRKGKIGFGEKIQKMGRRLGVDKEEINKSIYSSELYVNRDTGELLNTGVIKNNLEDVLDFSIRNLQTPVIKINPLTYFKNQLDVGQETTLKSAIYREGDVSAFTGDTLDTKKDIYNKNLKSAGVLSKEYVHIGENVYDGSIKNGFLENLKENESFYQRFNENLQDNIIAEGYEIINTQKGIGKTYADVLSGRKGDSASETNLIKEFLAIDSDGESIAKNLKERYTNFEDSDFGQNQPIGIATNYRDKNYDKASNSIENLGNKIRKRTVGLSSESFERIENMMAESINRDLGITGDKDRITADMFKSSEGLLDITEILSIYHNEKEPRVDGTTSDILNNLKGRISSVYNIASEDPDSYFSRKTVHGNDKLLQGNFANLTGTDKDKVYSGEDMLRGLIQEYGAIAMDSQGVLPENELSTSILSNTKKVTKELSELRTSTEAMFFSNKMSVSGTPTSRKEIVDNWVEHFGTDDTFEDLQNIMAKVEPFGGSKVQAQYESLTSTPKMAIKKHRGMIETINKGYTNMAGESPEFTSADTLSKAKQMAGFDDKTPLTPIFDALGEKINTITGHRGEVDTASILPWNLANNLNRGIDKFGLGISSEKRKSAASTVINLSIYRFGAPIAAYQTAKSMDDFLLGGAGRRQLAQGYANMHLGVAGIRDRTGMTGISNWMDEYVPGMEHLRGSPTGMRASKLTFGLVGDGRSEDEVQDYYERGMDPIRKGRWWQMGSTTPWIGSRIEYYRPNAYRRVMSDYEYTDTMHGSRQEYWQNHWMPNIYNPLAPIKHFVTDPYHYEKKHETSRPYAVTGGFASLQAIPVAGSTIDSVVSTFLKPSKKNKRLEKAHEQYLRQENEALISSYIGPNTGGQLDISPRGKANLTTLAPEVNIMDENTGFVDEEALIEDDMQFSLNKQRIGTGVSLGVKNKDGRRRRPIDTITDYAKSVLRGFNTSIASQSAYSSIYDPSLAGMPTQVNAQSPNMVHNKINPYKVNELSDVVRSTGMRDPAGQFMYGADQVRAMSGFFGYLSMNASGLVSRDDRIRLEDSSRYGDMNEGFWGLGMGGYDGLDGSLSEIGRRFTGAQQKRRYYNPIRNEMPEWMPSQDYFIDFQHGDPYKKVDYGEIRLPGEAYETIHRVQKDEYGNYSAFDRYRILADVAPYSDQYRFAKSEVALLNQNNLLSEERQDEYRKIREQVSSKNKKYRFDEKKFNNANITIGTVTVDKIIDQNTFLAKEYPNNPIKLAGVGIKADDAENVALMRAILKPGSKVKVGLDADPMGRIRDDMLDTMRGVIYAPKYSALNGDLPLRSGQNVNEFLSRQSEEDGGTVSIKDDGSAVATAALHTQGNLTIGKMNEIIVHDILPNIPFVNVMADKFYPVKTAVEEYEGQLYGKQFRSWHRPIKHWVKPMLDKATNMNPALAAVRGAGIISTFSKNSEYQSLFAEIGAGVYGTIAGVRSISEFARRQFGDEEKWIPGRREEQREFDEYFDKVEYIKYKGLYEQAKEMALKEEGVDIDAYLGAVKEDGESNDRYKNYLEVKKKNLTIAGKSSSSETVKDYNKKQIKNLNEKLKDIDNRRETGQVGEYTALAFRYKEEYESTLYGAKETRDYMKIHRALPKNDKEFFSAFQKATPKERQKILELIPKNQRNIYRQQWGIDEVEEDNVSLEEFFEDYKMPEENWEGWRPDVSLENIKIKVMQNEGMELTEANYWDEHVDRAEMDPSQPIAIEKLPNNLISKQINKGRLKAALEGAGLKDVRIGMRASASDVGYFNTRMNIVQDRENEIKEGIRTYLNN